MEDTALLIYVRLRLLAECFDPDTFARLPEGLRLFCLDEAVDLALDVLDLLAASKQSPHGELAGSTPI